MSNYKISPADQKRLEALSSEIENDYADRDDYLEYEKILKKYPEAHKKVLEKLKEKGVYSIMDLYKKKERAMNTSESWRIAGIIGVLVGVTIGLIYLSRRNK